MRHGIATRAPFDYAASGVKAPRKGERGIYHPPVGYTSAAEPIWPENGSWFTVDHTDGSITHVTHDNGKQDHFIWRFSDGPNSFHCWPSFDPRNLLTPSQDEIA